MNIGKFSWAAVFGLFAQCASAAVITPCNQLLSFQKAGVVTGVYLRSDNSIDFELTNSHESSGTVVEVSTGSAAGTPLGNAQLALLNYAYVARSRITVSVECSGNGKAVQTLIVALNGEW